MMQRLMRRLKNLAKIGLAGLLYIFGGFRAPREVPILAYHSVDETGSGMSVSERDFRRQMSYLKRRGYRAISLSELLAGRPKQSARRAQREVVITFDDGYKNNFSVAFPILKEFGFTAHIFLATDYIGDKPRWIPGVLAEIEKLNRDGQNEVLGDGENPSDLVVKYPYFASLTEEQLRSEIEGLKQIADFPMLSWDEIREMSDHGIHFHSHSCRHSRLSELSEEEIERELHVSRVVIQGELGKPVHFFCYPFGDFDGRVQRLAKDLGYLGACAFDENGGGGHGDAYSLRRIPMGGDFFGFWEFKFKLSAAYQWYRTLKDWWLS